jgi:hypothetical protein
MMRFIFILAVLFAAGSGSSSGQTNLETERSRFSPAAYYNYAERADVTILVNVWGTVRHPGLYEVPEGIRLSRLFSVAGGPQVGQRMQQDRRTVVARLSRNEDGRRRIIYESVMVNDVFASHEDPVLLDGDVLTVETVVRQGFSARDAFPVISAIGTLVLILERTLR